MRRFEPTYAGCGDCALSFTIPTSPGRNARTVSGFNRRPIYAQATAVFAPIRGAFARPGGSIVIVGCTRSPPKATIVRSRQANALQDIIISK
jgi:hypothetical protein